MKIMKIVNNRWFTGTITGLVTGLIVVLGWAFIISLRSPIIVVPEEIEFTSSQLSRKTSFHIVNNSDKPIFDIEIMLELQGIKSGYLNINLGNEDIMEDLSQQLGRFKFFLFIINLKSDKDEQFKLLKISKIDPHSMIPLSIKADKDVNTVVSIDAFKYSKKPSIISWKDEDIKEMSTKLDYPKTYKGKRLESTGATFFIKQES